MRAVNLIPRDARRAGISPAQLGPSHFIVALLVIALGAVTMYVLSSNRVSQRKAQLAGLKQQVSHIQAEVGQLNRYQEFEKLAQARAQTVRDIAATRFDWHSALSDLSKVVPANTSLQSVVATASPTTASGTTTGGPGGGVRGAINAPAFQLKGCTGTQDEVARLMSRLRLINGVTRVTLEDAAKQSSGTSTGAPSGGGQTGCPANGPSFDMVVFFQPIAGALPTTGTPGAAAAPTTPAGGAK